MKQHMDIAGGPLDGPMSTELKPLRDALAVDDVEETCKTLLMLGNGALPPIGNAVLYAYQCRQPEIDALTASHARLFEALERVLSSDGSRRVYDAGKLIKAHEFAEQALQQAEALNQGDV
jgi:hypothetical protein